MPMNAKLRRSKAVIALSVLMLTLQPTLLVTERSAFANNPCRVVDFRSERLVDAQNAVIACANWLMANDFRNNKESNGRGLQCVTFAERLWKLVTPKERSVKGRFENCAGRRFAQIQNLGKPSFKQPPAGEAGLPYLVWWSDPKVAAGCGHVAVYIGGGKFLDNAYVSKNGRKPWTITGNWPARGVRPSGYTTTGYWNS